MDERSTLGIVPSDYKPPTQAKSKRVFTDIVTSCQLMLENGGGLFEFPLPPDKTTVTIGRKSDYPNEPVSINLAPFNGFEFGVSRTHARFERAGSRLFLRDLASTNGTWLNGDRLTAHHVYEVAHGDRIEFGRLPAKLYIKET